ncbi:6-phosphogluconolactonase, partial [Candidatus Peregrinibacteria bacterium]|nr:6-phosphogluconolactonase [Candidatus Peregrinibacteria bacterium]
VLDWLDQVSVENIFKIGLAGGRTPLPLYQALAKQFGKDFFDFFLIDERYVNWQDNNSNYFQVSKIFDHVKSFKTNLPIDQALEDYKKNLPECFDLAIIGVGSDGHFASIFQGYQNNQDIVFHSQTDQFEVKDRLTIGGEYLLKTKKIFVVMAGSEKKKTYQELLEGALDEKQFPAKLLLRNTRTEILFAEMN